MQIRAERSTDQREVEHLHLSAFGGHHGRVVAGLVTDLRAAITDDSGLSLVAELDGQVVGHVMFTPNLLDAPRALVPVQVLSPIGVLPAHQRQGVGAALIEHGIATMVDRSVPLVFLEGDPAYYSRRGFVPAGPLGFRRPSLRIPETAFQVMPLPAREPWMTGTLVYRHEFWDHDCVGLRDP